VTTAPTRQQRLDDAELGWPDTLADYIGRHCPTEFPTGADKAAELIMLELVRPLLNDLERARGIAVTLEQENAALTAAAAKPDLEFTVRDHRPAPQGSKKRGRNGQIIDDCKRLKPWRDAVETAARDAMVDAQEDSEEWELSAHVAGLIEAKPIATLDGPLSVEVVFTVRKPVSAPKTRVTWPTTRDSGDIDKLLRSTFDALTTAGAIADDSKIVEVSTRKVHPGEGLDALEAPGAVIRVWRFAEAVTR
jgi:Holliday junction resolvase RusA-like endonuclease